MKKISVALAALLSMMMFTPLSAYSEGITDFTNLKDAIEGKDDVPPTSPVNITDLQSAITFTDKITVKENVNVTITGKEGASFSPTMTPGDPNKASYTKGAFEVNKGGSLNISGVNFDSFGEGTDEGVWYVIYGSGDVTIGPGVTFGKDIKTTPKGSGGFRNSATIVQAGSKDEKSTLTLQSSSSGDVTFETQNEAANSTLDVYLYGINVDMQVTGDGGKVEIGNGIGSDAGNTITHSGSNELILKGNNSIFSGRYQSTGGVKLTVDKAIKKFFGGTANIGSGSTLQWFADDTGKTKKGSGRIELSSGSNLIVGDSTSTSDNAVLTLTQGTDVINGNTNITINNAGSSLTLSGYTGYNKGLTIYSKVNGNGTLNLTNDDIAFEGSSSGLADTLKLVTSGSKITLKTLGSDDKTLEVIAKASNSNSDLVLNGYTGTTGSDLDINGTGLKTLTLQNTNNAANNVTGNVKVSGSGVIINDTGENTINGNLTVAEGSTANPALNNRATLKVDGNGHTFTNNGIISNSGKIILGEKVTGSNGKTGSITGQGSIEAQGSFSNDGIISSSAFSAGSLINGQNSTDAAITVSDAIKVEGGVTNSAAINGGSASFGSYTGQGSNDQLTLSGDLTITGGSGEETFSNAISNDGQISAKNITVTKGGVTNSGNITATETLTVTNGKFTNTAGTVSAAGGSLGEVDMQGGSLKNTAGGKLTISGAVTGTNGSIENSGNVTLTGDASGFKGTFTQKDGSTTVNNGGKLFDGKKTIEKGSLTVSGESMNWTGAVELAGGTTFNYTGTSESTVSNSVLSFAEGAANANANFNGSGGYSIANEFKGSGNNLNFTDTTVTLAGTDYSKAGKITLNNSTLNLHEETPKYQNYTFENFVSNGASVDLDLHIKNDEKKLGKGYLESDTLTFNSGSGTLKVGNLYIDCSGENGQTYYSTNGNILNGNVNFSNTKEGTIAWATNNFVYDVQVYQKTITISNARAKDENTLNAMNIYDGERQFMADGGYKIESDLDQMAQGLFNVFGKSKNSATDSLIGNGHRFFNLKDNVTELHIDNLTITGASSSTDGGSVLRNENADSKVFINDSVISNNTGTGNGGAIYNNGGAGTDPTNPESFTGLYVGNTTFDSNTTGDGSKGGAIYNDSNGFLYLEDVTTTAATGDGQNDIYNAGTAYIQGSNTFNSQYTNAGSGKSEFTGTNAFNALYTNEGTAASTFGGKNTFTELTNSSSAEVGVTFAEGSVNEVTKKFTNSGKAANSGSLTFSGSSEFNNTNEFTNAETGNLSIGADAKVTAESTGAKITNNGTIDLAGDASGYKGSFTQEGEKAQTTVKGNFFAGASEVKNGVLNWFTSTDLAKSEGASLKVSGDKTVFNIGDGKTNAGSITIAENSSIAEEVQTNIYGNGTLTVAGGADLTLNSNDKWLGTVNLNNGNLTLKDINNSYNTESGNVTGTLVATGGALTLTSADESSAEGGTNLVLGKGSSVDAGVNVNIGKNSKVFLEAGTFTMDSSDKWDGGIILDSASQGTLVLDAYTGNLGLLQAEAGHVNITNGSAITLHGEGVVSGIVKNVQTTIDETSSVIVGEGGVLTLDSDEGTADSWLGKVTLNEGGTLNYGMSALDENAILDAEKGNLNLLDKSILTLGGNSKVDDDVAVDIQSGSTVDMKGGNFAIDSATDDKWHGLIKNSGGNFTADNIKNHDRLGGHYQQTGGSATFTNSSDIVISGTDSYITGGSVTVEDSSKLAFATGNNLNLENLTVTNGSSFSILNAQAQTVTAGTQTVDETTNFALDLNLRNGASDKFVFDELKAAADSGVVNVSDFGFIGGAPTVRNVELQLFDVKDIPDNVTFSATDKQVMTPIGEYGLTSLGEGRFRASLGRYNPQVFRGQVATLAMYNNQIAIDDMILNHIILHSPRTAEERTANHYAAINPLFAPYQYTKEEGGLWYKAYVDVERLSMTQHLNVNNNSYGSLIGADLPLVHLKNDWEFIPTVYVGYNGSHQTFNNVSMWQNGGQGGFMGTFTKDDFIGSILAYGGGYSNEMNVAGYNDTVGNWFVGTAAKLAYNFHPTRHFIIQPTAMIAYNMFGKQSWGTDYGAMGMNSGMLNGISVAPGLNLIYSKETWSLYATFQYLFNINDHISGRAGEVDLPDVRMNHGYIQYGIGATKTFKDRLNCYLQFVIRNGGRTGVGFQLGLQYAFDWSELADLFRRTPKTTGMK